MAKSHSAPFDHAPHIVRRARNTVGSVVVLACLVSLNIVLHNQNGARFGGLISQSLAALDATQLVPVAKAVPVIIDPHIGKYHAIGEYLARRYRVSGEMATGIVAKAHDIGQEFKLDPLLILAVIGVESRFNPIAESTMGAKGLMQIIPRYHPDKFDPLGGEKVAFDTGANIIVGAGILKDYIRRTGDISDALQMYVGATSEESENGYSSKVMLERDRLNQILRQYQNHKRAAQGQPTVKTLPAAI